MLDAVDNDGRSDAELLEVLRTGDLSACTALYRRHAQAASRAAARSIFDAAERDDLVAEAFLRVLKAVRDGNGPREHMRPYLLTAVRNLAVDRSRQRSRISLFGTIPDRFPVERQAGPEEIVTLRWSSGLAWSAFCSLPGRWRTVLWHLEVEGASPREIAPHLGMSPNAVAALAVRAREGLRQAYLQIQVPDSAVPGCRSARQVMAAWVRGRSTRHQARRIAKHVAACQECHVIADGLVEFNQEVPSASRSSRLRYSAMSGAPLLYEACNLTLAPGSPAAAWGKTAATIATFLAISSPPTPVLAPPEEAVITAPQQAEPSLDEHTEQYRSTPTTPLRPNTHDQHRGNE